MYSISRSNSAISSRSDEFSASRAEIRAFKAELPRFQRYRPSLYPKIPRNIDRMIKSATNFNIFINSSSGPIVPNFVRKSRGSRTSTAPLGQPMERSMLPVRCHWVRSARRELPIREGPEEQRQLQRPVGQRHASQSKLRLAWTCVVHFVA